MVARHEMSAGDLMTYLMSIQSTQKAFGKPSLVFPLLFADG
jgi:hypothetical protein